MISYQEATTSTNSWNTVLSHMGILREINLFVRVGLAGIRFTISVPSGLTGPVITTKIVKIYTNYDVHKVSSVQ